ncbi:MAG: hypothetical protein P1U40_05640 [Coxiellaceae bacterium]|nr:hypothetical protein [Coxiellaceae bacterium]
MGISQWFTGKNKGKAFGYAKELYNTHLHHRLPGLNAHKQSTLERMGYAIYAQANKDPSVVNGPNTRLAKANELAGSCGLTPKNTDALRAHIKKLSELPATAAECKDGQSTLHATLQSYDKALASQPTGAPPESFNQYMQAQARAIDAYDAQVKELTDFQQTLASATPSSSAEYDQLLDKCESQSEAAIPTAVITAAPLDRAEPAHNYQAPADSDLAGITAESTGEQKQTARDSHKADWVTQHRTDNAAFYTANEGAYEQRLAQQITSARQSLEAVAPRGVIAKGQDAAGKQILTVNPVETNGTGTLRPPPLPTPKLGELIPRGETIGDRATMKAIDAHDTAAENLDKAQLKVSELYEKHRGLEATGKIAGDGYAKRMAAEELAGAQKELASAKDEHTTACDNLYDLAKLGNEKSAHRIARLLRDQDGEHTKSTLQSLLNGLSPNKANGLQRAMDMRESYDKQSSAGYRVSPAKNGFLMAMYHKICQSDPLLGLVIYGICRLISFIAGKPCGIFEEIEGSKMLQGERMKCFSEYCDTEGPMADKLEQRLIGLEIDKNELHFQLKYDEAAVKQNYDDYKEWLKQPGNEHKRPEDYAKEEGKPLPTEPGAAKKLCEKHQKGFHKFSVNYAKEQVKKELADFKKKQGLKAEEHKDDEAGNPGSPTAVSAERDGGSSPTAIVPGDDDDPTSGATNGSAARVPAPPASGGENPGVISGAARGEGGLGTQGDHTHTTTRGESVAAAAARVPATGDSPSP